MSETSGDAKRKSERRSDFSARARVEVLLELIREFYSMCHMVAVGQLEPAKAKAKARDVEERLSAMMAEMLEQADTSESRSGPE